MGCYFGEVGRDALPRVLEEKAAQQRRPTSRHHRVETERFKSFSYDDLMKRDKVNLDIFWLKDEAWKKAPTSPPPRSSPPTSLQTSKPLWNNSPQLPRI